MDSNNREICKAYNDIFNTEQGRLVLEDLKKSVLEIKNEKDPNELFRKVWFNNGKESLITIIEDKKDRLNKINS